MTLTSIVIRLIKIFFIQIIPIALILISFQTYQYAKTNGLFQQSTLQPLPYDHYTLSKTSHWPQRFDFLHEKTYNELNRRIVEARGHILEVRRGEQRYLIEYEYDVDDTIIEQVAEVAERGDETAYEGRYFIVKYHNFIEIVYFNVSVQGQKSLTSFESEVCLQLPIEAGDNVRYHIDSHNNIWIVTLSMNKIVYIQIYSCLEAKLIKEYRYSLQGNNFINSIYRIVRKSEQCMHVQVMTYGLNRVDIEVCPQELSKHGHDPTRPEIREFAVHRTNEIVYEQRYAKEWRSYSEVEEGRQANELSKIINFILEDLNIDYRLQVQFQAFRNPVEDIKEEFNTISTDAKNHYLINISKNESETGILALDKYLIDAKTPLFHSNSNYQQYGIMDVIRKETKGETNPIFLHKYIDKKLNHTNKLYYKAAYETHPNFKIEHLGLGDKALIFWPEQRLQDSDYLAIRTKDGALITQKTEFKGVYDKLPVSFEEVRQRLDDKPAEVVPGIFELHAKEQLLISRAVIFQKSKEVGKLQLINMLNGKPIVTHYIRVQDGYRYTSSFLLNNEWWVLEYSPATKASIAKKYEFFVEVAKPDKVLTLSMTYGNLSSEAHLNREDDLAALMEQFLWDNNNGFMLLNVYRCIDEYYYFEFTDADASLYGVARVHFQKMTNRLRRAGQNYNDNVRKKLMLEQSQLAPPKYSTRPYAVALKDIDVFGHIKYFTEKQPISDQTWSMFCSDSLSFRKLQKLEKYYYYPQQIYALGSYGCDSDRNSPSSERIFSFNMRNIIIHGRVNTPQSKQTAKHIVYLILSVLPTYVILVSILVACCRQSKADTTIDEEKEKKEN